MTNMTLSRADIVLAITVGANGGLSRCKRRVSAVASSSGIFGSGTRCLLQSFCDCGQLLTSGPSGHASASLLFTYIQTCAAVDSSIAFLYLLRFNLIFSLHCCMKSVRKQVYGQFSVVHAMTGVLAWLESRGVEIQVVLCEACHCFLQP